MLRWIHVGQFGRLKEVFAYTISTKIEFSTVQAHNYFKDMACE